MNEAEKRLVEEYIHGVKKMLALDSWGININWKGAGNDTSVMALYDYEKCCMNIAISESLLATEEGIRDLFSAIVHKMVSILSNEVVNVVHKFERQIAKVVLGAMKIQDTAV